MAHKKYVLQESGSVTLPADFRKKYNLKPGDEIRFVETEDGLLISARETLIDKLLDEIGSGLRAKGITLEQLMEDGRKIRGDILREDYGIEAGEDD